jgi:GNAT superfamily N-acetyltransferase
MNIRLATINDRDNILLLLDELIKEVNKKSGKHAVFTKGEEGRKKMYEELLNMLDVKIFVVEEASNLIGIADLFIMPIMRRGYYQGHIEDFVITENMRGKGIGTALMNAIKNYCRENNIKVIKLTSGFELEDAHKFYEKQGGVHTEKMFRFDLK